LMAFCPKSLPYIVFLLASPSLWSYHSSWTSKFSKSKELLSISWVNANVGQAHFLHQSSSDSWWAKTKYKYTESCSVKLPFLSKDSWRVTWKRAKPAAWTSQLGPFRPFDVW
jgi:hypothetical protein